MRLPLCSPKLEILDSLLASLLITAANKISLVSGFYFSPTYSLMDSIVSGIGHKIKSVNNPDLRVELVKEYVLKHFPSHNLLDYALAVQQVTTAKKDTVSCTVSFARARY
jgi:hypothetical protein